MLSPVYALTLTSKADVKQFWLERYGYRSAREAGGAHDCPDWLALGIDPNSSLSVLDMMECAQLAEKKGFAARVAERCRGEVFALLSALAMRTSRMRLGAGILPVLVRSPWVVATGAATVDEISGGRFMLGLGAGHKSVIDDRHGLAYDRPTLRMREVADIVRRALSGEPVNFEREIYR